MSYPDRSLRYNSNVPPRHHPRPEITAQSNDRDAHPTPTIDIQALSSHPELLGQSWAPSKRKKHQPDCECETCELGDEVSELDF